MKHTLSSASCHTSQLHQSELNHVTAAPPAYTPYHNEQHTLARLGYCPQPYKLSTTNNTAQKVDQLNNPSHTMPIMEEQQYNGEDTASSSSTISIRINTSIKIYSNNNIIHLKETPADHAKTVAEAVVCAIEEHSSGRCGIPMVDEDGAPRPIQIEVDAGITVRGEGNFIGGSEIPHEVNSERKAGRRRRREDPNDQNESNNERRPRKRRMAEVDKDASDYRDTA